MTPYQFSRTSHRQRMLAGLNTLGFAIPPTVESQRAGMLTPNLGMDVKVGGATVGSMSAVQKANTLAAPGEFKSLIGGTLSASRVGSGIDARAGSAQMMLTAAGDKLNLRANSLTNLPPKTGFLPGSTINPTRPDITPNPFNKVNPDLQRAMDRVRFPDTPRTTTGQDLIDSTRPKADPVMPGGSSPSNDGRSTTTPPVTSTPDPRASFTDQRPPVRDDRALGPEAVVPREDLEIIFPELSDPLAERKRFPVGMVLAGVAAVGLVGFLMLRK